jgi:hypothetical protein
LEERKSRSEECAGKKALRWIWEDGKWLGRADDRRQTTDDRRQTTDDRTLGPFVGLEKERKKERRERERTLNSCFRRRRKPNNNQHGGVTT